MLQSAGVIVVDDRGYAEAIDVPTSVVWYPNGIKKSSILRGGWEAKCVESRIISLLTPEER